MTWLALAVVVLVAFANGANDNFKGVATVKELAHRISDGIDISLYWNERSNRITVRVYDARSDEGFELDVDGRRALDAYRHPFAYAAEQQTGEKMDATGKLAA